MLKLRSQVYDDISGSMYFVNDLNDEKWCSSYDSDGRIYFYQDGTQRTAWELPKVAPMPPQRQKVAKVCFKKQKIIIIEKFKLPRGRFLNLVLSHSEDVFHCEQGISLVSSYRNAQPRWPWLVWGIIRQEFGLE